MSKGSKRNNPTFFHERQAQAQGFSIVIGVDEAGRGPLAGPVVASAVSIHTPKFHTKIVDSKLISPQQREEAFHEIMDNAMVGIGIISEAVIDRVNILEASFLAMTNAVVELMTRLPKEANVKERVYLLIDGNRFKSDLPFKFKTIVDGDSHVFSIACASIVAKVTRDRILRCYDQVFPEYGFARHKGYPTKQHKAALNEFGPSMIHRLSFSY